MRGRLSSPSRNMGKLLERKVKILRDPYPAIMVVKHHQEAVTKGVRALINYEFVRKCRG